MSQMLLWLTTDKYKVEGIDFSCNCIFYIGRCYLENEGWCLSTLYQDQILPNQDGVRCMTEEKRGSSKDMSPRSNILGITCTVSNYFQAFIYGFIILLLVLSGLSSLYSS